MPDLPRAMFFDLDDTLIDDSSNVDSGWRAAVGDLAPSGIDTGTLLALVHEVRDWLWADPERHRIYRADLRGASTWIVAEALSKLGTSDQQLASRIANRYRDLREEGQTLLPGAIETLEALVSQGMRLALLTNGSASGQRAKIERFDLAGHFDYICVEGEFGHGKPDERVYRAALDALESKPESTWMIGDNLEWDVAAPMRLGITGIWFDRHNTGLPDGNTTQQPDRVIRSLTELL